MIFRRQACYYVSESKYDGYDATVQCGIMAEGSRLAVAMNRFELNALIETTPNENIWLGIHSKYSICIKIVI